MLFPVSLVGNDIVLAESRVLPAESAAPMEAVMSTSRSDARKDLPRIFPGKRMLPRWRLPVRRSFESNIHPRFGRRFARSFDRSHVPRLVKKYAEAPVVRVDLLGRQRQQAMEELSLAEINRFQFRRNRPEEPGLPRKSPLEAMASDAP